MKMTVRQGVFETNSSSVHSLTMATKDDYEKFENGELLPNAEKIKIICDELGIYELDLFNREYAFSNKKNLLFFPFSPI